MPKEKMAELKITVPARWVGFIKDLYAVAGLDQDKELRDWIKANITADIEARLDAKERVELVERHNLSDVYPIPQWVRNKAAALPEPEGASA